MKKSYINPEMTVVELNMAQPMLTGSVLGGSVLNEEAGPDIPGLAPGFNDLENLVDPMKQFGIPGL